MSRNPICAASLLTLALLLDPAFAGAQTYVRADCRKALGQPAPHFDDQIHGQWYRRFWNGDCGSLSFCASGSPSWNGAVAELKARAASAKRASVTLKACRLGRLIGFEWARDNSIRKIDTGQLEEFINTLQTTQDPTQALATVEAEANADLSR